jgi:hypothetical protein
MVHPEDKNNNRGDGAVIFGNLTLTLRSILTMRRIHMNLLKKEREE